MNIITEDGKPRGYYDGPLRVVGCRWEMWSGVIGITEDLNITDGDRLVGIATDLPDDEREVLANKMIALWKRFKRGDVIEDRRELQPVKEQPNRSCDHKPLNAG